jgi:hypothetical protein
MSLAIWMYFWDAWPSGFPGPGLPVLGTNLVTVTGVSWDPVIGR